MQWHVINHALNELPDEVVLVLSAQTRQEIRQKTPDSGARGEDATYHGGWHFEWATPDGRPHANIARKILAYRDLALGWKIARACARGGLPLPSALAGEGEALYRAYLYLLNPDRFADDAIETALFWHTPAMRGLARVLQGLLVAVDVTPTMAADALNLKPEHVRVYEHLFFNVTSRKADATWLQQHVFPNTRMIEFYQDYVQNADYGHLLQRAGLKNGAEHVLRLAGIAMDPLDAMSAANSAAQLEAYLLSTALLMAQNGWGNERDNAMAIFHSRQLMAAAKIGGEDTAAGSELLSMGDTLRAELLATKKAEAHEAYILQNEARIVEADVEVL